MRCFHFVAAIVFISSQAQALTCHDLFSERTSLFSQQAKLINQYAGPEVTPAEIAAIHDNFSSKPVENGPTGVFTTSAGRIIDPNVNLISSYRAFRKILIENSRITVEDILSLRQDGQRFQVDSKGDVIETGFTFKKAGSTATITSPLHAEVALALKEYGYEVAHLDNGRTRVRYPDEARIQKNLQFYVSMLNHMLSRGYGASRITSFAVQELLLIHPFSGGNGRTARLIGQAIYFHLTGKAAVFPSEFHKEMSYSIEELAVSLKKSQGGIDSIDLTVLDFIATIKNRKNLGQNLKTVNLEVPSAVERDESFYGEFRNNGKKIVYHALPEQIRKHNGDLYYGRPAKSPEEAEDFLKKLFQFGRGSRGQSHHDIEKHVTSSQSGPSGFFSTSALEHVAKAFAQKKDFEYGLLVIVDGHKAEVLDLAGLIKNTDFKNGFNDEQEVLFAKNLNASRIKGAQLIKWVKDSEGWRRPEAVVYYPNPNYLPRSSTSDRQ